MSTATVVPTTTLVTEARVRRTERLSPSFVRVTLESEAFAELAPDEGFDTRFKMIFPRGDGCLPDLLYDSGDWYQSWLAMSPTERAPMRTYTIRDVVTEGADVLLVVDLVVHQPISEAGPACRWAASARPGDVVQVVVPRRNLDEHGLSYGGGEFAPGSRRRLLIAADETAVPAVSRILLDLDPGFTGTVFCEVPRPEDVLSLPVPPGLQLHWLPRESSGYGRRLVNTVRDHLGLTAATAPEPTLSPAHTLSPAPDPSQDEADLDIWETARYSASEAAVTTPVASPQPHDLYAWIAGESWAVKTLRRSLVSELNIDRSDVAFMGYWREGVAMKS